MKCVTCDLEVPGSNLGIPSVLAEDFLGFPQFLDADTVRVPQAGQHGILP